MTDLTAILDELSWAASTEEVPDESSLLEIIAALEKLGEIPAHELPEEVRDTVDDMLDLALAARDDAKRRSSLAMILNTVFGGRTWGTTEAADDLDDEDDDILSAFIATSTEGVGDLEQCLLTLESDYDLEKVAEAKRAMHTVKGECGVLSLHTAQALWHEAENLIEEALERSMPIPLDPLIELLDWHRDYLAALGENRSAAPPDSQALLGRLAGALGQNKDSSPGDPTTDAGDVAEAADSGELVAFSDETLADETVPEFITEAMVHLEDSEAALLELEDDPSSTDGIDRVFRSFHTIKGVAGFLELKPITRLAHASETLLDKFRQSPIPFTAAHADLVLAAKDMLAKLLDALTGQPGPSVAAFERLIECTEAMAEDPEGANPLGTSVIKEALADCGIDSAESIAEAAANPIKTTERLGSILIARNALTREQLDAAVEEQAKRAEDGNPPRLGEVLIAIGAISEDALKDALQFQRTGEALGELLATTAVEPQPETAPVDVPAQPPAKRAPAATAPKKKSGAAGGGDTTIRVNTQRLDALVDMVGELVIAQQMVVQDTEVLLSSADDRLGRNLSHLGKITRDLQEASMSLRMVTFKSTFQKMHRLVRDVAAKASKKVRLVVEGADTEVDRNVVDKISDPLVHLVRNAIDHGLEGPEARAAAGKGEEGQVTLSARHQGGAIVISLQDDGRGLSRDKIIAKARERGLLPKGTDPSELSDSAVNRLIFEPGFSTAAQVTDISGRGVGMDVVKRNIEAMRGKIEIVSREGHGTTFQIHLPLTLAIIDAMVVRAGTERYVVPTLSIVQSFQPSTSQVHTIRGSEPVVEVRGELVPVCSLSEAVGGPYVPLDPSNSTLILVEAMGRRACLVVDEILGQQQVVIKKLGGCMPALGAVSGGAILGDGRVALIVDTEGVLSTINSTSPA